MQAYTDNTIIPATRSQRRATALCAESFTACASSSREPLPWKQLVQADERGEICEGVLRIVLASVLVSAMLTGILW